MDWTEKTLIRLKRQYEKDEIISAFIKKARDVEIENGKLKSYIDELEYKVLEAKKEAEENTKKNGGEIWFKKYDELLKEKESNRKTKRDQLQFKLIKQLNHGKMLEKKLSAYVTKLKSRLTRDEYKLFVMELENTID